MSTFKIEFKTGNAMFAEDPDEDNGRISGPAVAGVLRDVASYIEDFTFSANARISVTGPVKDFNGTVIGNWAFTEDAA